MDNGVLSGPGGEVEQWDGVGQHGRDTECVALRRHHQPVSQQCWLLPHDGAKRPGISCARSPRPHEGICPFFAAYTPHQSRVTGSVLPRGIRLRVRENQNKHGGLQGALLGGSELGAPRSEGLLGSRSMLGAPHLSRCSSRGEHLGTLTPALAPRGKPPESAEQGPCQPAPLPPCTPKPSPFQKIGTCTVCSSPKVGSSQTALLEMC